MPLHRACHPQAVDVHIPFRPNGNPGHFRRNVLNEAFPPLGTFQEYQAVPEPLCQPRLFGDNLHIPVTGNGAADMLLLNIFFCYPDIFHCDTSLLFRSSALWRRRTAAIKSAATCNAALIVRADQHRPPIARRKRRQYYSIP